MDTPWIIVTGIAALVAVLVMLWLVCGRARPVSVPAARAAFNEQREQLQARFFQAASASGKPRGLRWKSCEFGDALELARDKRSRDLLALMPVTIAFEAIPGSDMEGLPAVGNLRSATAVFNFRNREWTTNGRAVFNMSPAETVRHFGNHYEPVT